MASKFPSHLILSAKVSCHRRPTRAAYARAANASSRNSAPLLQASSINDSGTAQPVKVVQPRPPRLSSPGKTSLQVIPPTPPRRRTTDAPQTVHGVNSTAADPRLVRITGQLLGAKNRRTMQALLSTEQVTAADFRKLMTYLDRQDAIDVAGKAFRCLRRLGLTGTEDAVIWTKLITMNNKRPGGSFSALKIYNEMLAVGVKPDRVTYNVAIAAAGKAPLWPKVTAVMADMKAAGVPPDAFTYSSMLSACQANNKWQQALRWLGDMEAAGVTPNVVHYTCVITVLQRAGEWKKSLKVFEKMEAAGVAADVMSYNSAIAACAKVRESLCCRFLPLLDSLVRYYQVHIYIVHETTLYIYINKINN